MRLLVRVPYVCGHMCGCVGVTVLLCFQAAAEERIVKLRGQLENLRQQLASSELVQQDFVRLSQNLQVDMAVHTMAVKHLDWGSEYLVSCGVHCPTAWSLCRSPFWSDVTWLMLCVH